MIVANFVMHEDNKPECPEKKVRLSSHNPCFSRFFSSAETSSLFSAAAFFIHIRRLPFKSTFKGHTTAIATNGLLSSGGPGNFSGLGGGAVVVSSVPARFPLLCVDMKKGRYK